MKKTLSILFGIGIIVAGVWVYKTRAPVALQPLPGVSVAPDAALVSTPTPTPTPAPGMASLPTGDESPVRKIAHSLKAPDQRKFLILEEILLSRNDNDMRLDTEFKNMTPELKKAMTQFYSAIPPEGRNERGTIVFLLARDLKTAQEVGFLKEVLMEKPCLSLADCSKDEAAHSGEHGHLDGIAETTAHYPQLTALRQSLERYHLARGENPPNQAVMDELVAMFRHATGAPNLRVAEEAQRILKYIGK